MNWKNIKTFLIILLLAVDLLLVYFCADYYFSRDYTRRETAEDAAAILAAQGVEVSPDLLAARVDRVPVRTCAYVREDYLRLVVSLLFGKNADGFYLLPGGLRAETAAGDVAVVGKDLSLHFVGAGRDVSAMEAAYAKGSAVTVDISASRTALENLLALPDGGAKNFAATSADGYVFFTLSPTASGIPLCGGDCVFGFVGDRLVYADGSYLFLATGESELEPLLTRANILLSEQRRGAHGKVVSLTLCYAPYEDEAEGTLLLLPAYRVEYADGSASVVNALTGEKY